MEITVENLERAVSQFYHSDSSLQAQAHQWLTAVQSSPNAWAFVWELLQPNRSGEAQFFAATTLHNKLMKSWSEIPTDQYSFLKAKLVDAIIQYSSGPKIVLNRLCIALSAYVVQTTPQYWENSLSELMTMFRPESLPNVAPERTIWILLEVLTVIPEEFQSMTLSQQHKTCVRLELERSTPQVLNLVESVLEWSEGAEVRTQAVKTSVAWLHLGVPLPSCGTLAEKLVQSARLNAPIDGAEYEMEALSQMGTHPDTHKFPQSVLRLVTTLLPLRELISSAPDNPELVANTYRVFVGLAECHTRLLVGWLLGNEASVAHQLISTVLACTAAPGIYPTHETHSQMTFAFWYILQDELVSLSKEDSRRGRELLVPVYEEVCRVLLRKSQFPHDSEPPLSSADAELFRCYRQDIADTIVYCYYVVRDYVVRLLTGAMARAETWQEVEAVLHVSFAIAEATGPEEAGSSPGDDAKVVALLASVPPHLLNPRVVNTLNQAIGAYAEWLGSQEGALGQLMPGLVAALQSTETSSSATMALKDVTRECTTSLKPYARPLLVTCQEALAKGHLRQNECVRLMHSVGRLLSILPYDEMLQQLEPLVSDYASTIQHLLTQEVSSAVKCGLTVRLRMLGTLCSTLYLDEGVAEQPPSLLLLKRLLPVLTSVVQSWPHDLSVIQEVCLCLKNCVSSLLEKCEPMLGPMLSIVVTCYSSQPNPAALELVRQLVVLFGWSHGEVVGGVMRCLTERTMNLALTDGWQSEACDVVQAFHNLAASLVKRNPPLLIASAHNPSSLFNFATACLALPEAASVKACGSFLVNLIAQSRKHPPLVALVHSHGLDLVVTTLRCIGGEAPRSCLDTMAEVLLALNKKYCDLLSRWLNEALATPGFPSPRATPQAKANFSRIVLRERANKRRLLDTVQEFALLCRGLITVAYDP